ncbi:hypothetical protein HAX54_001824 [Datura stramonium]|uniref:Uncharacterized protein n=1 Tax=Datura stramonium TaxID=4076 RepID=A0ABS8T2Z1_DATST|nr:hypothetical protein [Datura stramonium]
MPLRSKCSTREDPTTGCSPNKSINASSSSDFANSGIGTPESSSLSTTWQCHLELSSTRLQILLSLEWTTLAKFAGMNAYCEGGCTTNDVSVDSAPDVAIAALDMGRVDVVRGLQGSLALSLWLLQLCQ